jgi:hypothetical protein
LAKKKKIIRPWTATDVHKLKGLAKKKAGVEKIARALKRTVAARARRSARLVKLSAVIGALSLAGVGVGHAANVSR